MDMRVLLRIILIVLCVILGLLLISLILFPFVKRKYEITHFRDIYYKKINRVALDNDYLLINNLVLKDHSGLICTIDHILFAHKYIYVIKDRYYRGGISGVYDDNVWFFYGQKGIKQEFENPMKINEKRIEKLASITHFDKEYFVSIVLINDNAIVKDLKSLNTAISFIIPKSRFKKLIKTIESKDIPDIDQKGLEKAVLEIAELKGKVVNDEVE